MTSPVHGIPKSVEGLRRFGPHHYTLVRAYALTIAACAAQADLRLVRWRFEWELIDAFAALPQRPDALCTVADAAGREWTYWIEVDTSGTENPSFVRRTKFVPFARRLAVREPIAGVLPSAMLALARTERRIRSLGRAGAVDAPIFLCPFTEACTSLSFTRGWTRLTEAAQGLGDEAVHG